MEVMVTTEVIGHTKKLQSNRYHQQTNTQLFTGRMPFLSPNQQSSALNGKAEIRNAQCKSQIFLLNKFSKNKLKFRLSMAHTFHTTWQKYSCMQQLNTIIWNLCTVITVNGQNQWLSSQSNTSFLCQQNPTHWILMHDISAVQSVLKKKIWTLGLNNQCVISFMIRLKDETLKFKAYPYTITILSVCSGLLVSCSSLTKTWMCPNVKLGFLWWWCGGVILTRCPSWHQ